MSTAEPQEAGSYFSDTEHAAEMVRLIKQARYMTRCLQGPLPAGLDPAGLHAILDLACGPGEWVLEVAKAYPDAQVTGIDISQTMIHFAQQFAHSPQYPNVAFQIMDVTAPLAFPDASFDLIHARLLFSFMQPATWPRLLAECRRVLRPGGMIVLVEAEEPFSTSPAFEYLMHCFNQALVRRGQSFSPDGRHTGITVVLSHLLRQAGFTGVQQQAYVLDYSASSPIYAEFYENFRPAFHLAQPFILKAGVSTPMEVLSAYNRALEEVQVEDFCALEYVLRAWGTRPS
jgi:ubiquinone/menaquinone biosynthesis C-methylase UbiE